MSLQPQRQVDVAAVVLVADTQVGDGADGLDCCDSEIKGNFTIHTTHFPVFCFMFDSNKTGIPFAH